MKRNDIVMLLLGVTMLAWSTQVNAGGYGGGCDDGCCLTCPQCNGCCDLKSEKVDEDKHCWKVECKPICIPRIVFPWQKPLRGGRHGNGYCDSCTGGACCGDGCCNECRSHNGAHVKIIKVLKKHTYTCPTCKYSWTPPECCGDGCSGDGCCDGCDGEAKWSEDDAKVEDDSKDIDPVQASGKQASLFRRGSTARSTSRNQLINRRVPVRAKQFARPVGKPLASKSVRTASFSQPSGLHQLFK